MQPGTLSASLAAKLKPMSQEDLCDISKLLVLDLLTVTQKDMYSLWKHENMTEKVVQLGTELRWWW